MYESFLVFLFCKNFETLFRVLVADPKSQMLCRSLKLAQHLSIHLGQVEHVSDAIVTIFWVDGPFAKEGEVSFTPHIVELVFIFVYSMARLVSLKDFVETRCAHIGTLRNHLFCRY